MHEPGRGHRPKRALILSAALSVAGCITVQVVPPTASLDAAPAVDGSLAVLPPSDDTLVAPQAARPTCRDFPSHAAAQAAFEADRVGLAHLDGNRDGRACTSRR